MKKRFAIVGLIFSTFFFYGCKGKSTQQVFREEDRTAKEMFQGVWMNEGREDVAFRVKGDTVYYADSVSLPAYFQIFRDTLVLHGVSDVKYAIVKQASHLFVFVNQNGDQVRLVKSEDPNDLAFFEETQSRRPIALNQNCTIKRDTVIIGSNRKYHCYVQVNPTTYKVIKPSYNDDGVEVGNVYYDNIVHLSIYEGPQKLFSKDFRKQDFTNKVPAQFLKVSILSDLLFSKIDAEGIHYTACIATPDEPSSYQVDVCVTENGKLKMQVK